MTWHPEPTKGGFKALGYWGAALVVIWVMNFFVEAVHPYYFTIIMYAGINVILAVSLNLVNGFTGQFSMGHAGFMSIGGYVSAFLTVWVQSNYPDVLGMEPSSTLVLLLALAAGGLVSGLAGYLVGLPSLRLKGDYLAIVTLGFGEIIRVVLLNIDSVGGARGMPGIPFLSSFGWVYSFALFTTFVVWRIVNSAHGRTFLAVREDEIAAEAMGVNTTRAKVRAFVLGAVFAGFAGGLYGHYLRFLIPSAFDFNKSFEIIIMVVLGGMGSVTGSIVAALFLSVIREALRPLQEITKVDLRMVIYSLVLIILMLTKPNGLFGTKEISDFLPKRLKRLLSLRGEQ